MYLIQFLDATVTLIGDVVGDHCLKVTKSYVRLCMQCAYFNILWQKNTQEIPVVDNREYYLEVTLCNKKSLIIIFL